MNPSVHKIFLLAFLFPCIPAATYAQGAFQNLDFESAHLTAIPSGQFGSEVPIIKAIPGWSGCIGPDQVTQILQNNLTLGDASIDILGPQWNFGGIIEGQYTVLLQSGVGSGPVNPPVSISQTGVVPANTQSLEFKAATTAFTVTLGGQELSIVALENGVNYTLYGAIVPPSFDNQTEQLSISLLPGQEASGYFDSFSFSPNSVPEPQTWSLLLCATAALALKRLK